LYKKCAFTLNTREYTSVLVRHYFDDIQRPSANWLFVADFT